MSEDARQQTTPWQAGQRAVINRQAVVTVDRVTASGRPKVGDRTFDVDGTERAAGVSFYRRAKLEHITPDIEAEMALRQRASAARSALYAALETVEKWQRDCFGSFRGDPDEADVAKAERLVSAITGALNV